MDEAGVESAAREAAPSVADFGRETLIAGERILAKFHPHWVSFLRWYLPSFLLFVWTATYLLLHYFFASAFTEVNNAVGPIAPLLFWAIGAFVIAFIMPRNPRTSRENTSAGVFLKAVHYVYLALLALPFILYFVFALRGQALALAGWIQLYALLLSVLLIGFMDMYRRSFSYFVTNFRVIFRYRFFKTAENNLRFSQIRDVEINRTLIQRLVGVGNVRPYTGTEENLVDLTPGYDSPDECFFGVRNPEYVKRLILEQMLGPTDTLHTSVYGTGAPPEGGAPGDISGPLPAGAVTQPSATAAAVRATASAADAERIKKLERELEALRTADVPKGTRETAPAFKAASSTDLPASRRAKLADVQPTIGVREPEKPQHAEFGDDRDGFASHDNEFRGAKKDEKKPAPKDDDADRPRGI